MGRPQTPIGAHGAIRTTEIRPGVWEAYTRFRDTDGGYRPVRRQGKSRTGAENNIKKALAERDASSGTATANARVADIAARWLEHQRELVEAGERAPRTYATYESALRLHVLPGLGQLRLREATTGRCEAWLVALRRGGLGPSMCATARKVLSGVLGMAARMDAIPTNPTRDLSPIPGSGRRKRKPRAMTADERTAWLTWLDNNVAHDPRKPGDARHFGDPAEMIRTRALGDITRLMLATGCRIGEIMALGWDDVDLEAGTVKVTHHLVWVTGQGVYRQPGAKSEAGDRVLRLPSWGRDVLMRRRIESEGASPVFPSEVGGWRDPNLVMRWIRWSREPAGFGWVTSHVWRQTVITVLDEAGLTTREVANQAGHADIAQTQSYMSRAVASDRAAEALENLL